MTPYQRLLLPENLYYAWCKAQRCYRMVGGHVDNGELLEFELDLENRLQNIANQFVQGEYKLQKLRPLPRPKKIKDGNFINRQYYHIAVDDQVAWIAVVNALGPEIDSKMPAWSYGHRLYRPAWYEDKKENRASRLEIGPYRHASGYLYRKFKHSWPLFKKHISLTAQAMTQEIIKEKASESDQDALNAAISAKLPYLNKNYWKKQRGNQRGNDLYYASIDLKQFYPKIPIEDIPKELMPTGNPPDEHESLSALLQNMLEFTLDTDDIAQSILKNYVDPEYDINIEGLPTGLFAAGFLANVATLPVDKEVVLELKTEKTIAHFKFVDDHAFLAYDFDKLCEWIKWYKDLMEEQLGIEINKNKYDPESLSKWLNRSKKLSDDNCTESKELAKKDSKIDGTNPTKLLTKTLERVSTIAFQSADILDNLALKNRMEELEWLLLANIPEREIRPDTRAAFAAGQMVALAPMLIQTGDIVDTHREISRIESKIQSLKKNFELNKEKIKELEKEIDDHKKTLFRKEKNDLLKYFNHLLSAIKEHPEKSILFFRLHQYCMQTGHQGLQEIAKWINDLKEKTDVWGDYYSSLTLQILAQNVLKAIKTYTSTSMLRSEQKAAKNYLKDIAKITQSTFKISQRNESWFHKASMREYAVSIFIATEYLKNHDPKLSSRLKNTMESFGSPTRNDNSSAWLEKTGYTAGNWAYFVEKTLNTDNSDNLNIGSNPTCLWKIFIENFDYSKRSDQRAIRLYPEVLPSEAWRHFLKKDEIKDDDSGWIYDVIKAQPKRAEDVKGSNIKAFEHAIKILETSHEETHISIADWIEYINGDDCDPFDPRKSEWTALKIVKRVIACQSKPETNHSLDQIHPRNILIPKSWKIIPNNEGDNVLTWEKWRSRINSDNEIIIFEPKDSLMDYRYHSHTNVLNPNTEKEKKRLKLENQLKSIGIMLLGLLCENHSLPARWNIRGNEKAVDIPRARIFRSLAISSPTLLLIEGCIAPRSAESRLIIDCLALFGLQGGSANDTQYDPPLLNSLEDLESAITKAQDTLEKNQLSVARHQPRQLIPFNILAFAISESDEPTEDMDGE